MVSICMAIGVSIASMRMAIVVSFTCWLRGVYVLDDLSRSQNWKTDPSRSRWGVQWDWVAWVVMTTSADIFTGIDKGHERASINDSQQNHKSITERTRTLRRLDNKGAQGVDNWFWTTEHNQWMSYLQRLTIKTIKYITKLLHLMTYVSWTRKDRWGCSGRHWSNQNVISTLTTLG